ncbi:peptidoglycan editing factor PgeF, partial [bacterium]|nr:peptidoglycan editing factor PgeF [bacterium]
PFDQLNMGITTDDKKENIEENRRRFFEAVGIDKNLVVIQKQVHETRSAYVSKPAFLDCTDAAFTDQRNVFLTVSAADCVPVLFIEPQKKIVGVIHAGWRGTENGITNNTIENVKQQFNIDAAKIVAVIGPSISVNHYEVSEAVASRFDREFVVRDGYSKPHLDLWKANEAQLKKAGVGNVFISGYCTVERRDLFFSHRGSGGRSGRMLGVIGII